MVTLPTYLNKIGIPLLLLLILFLLDPFNLAINAGYIIFVFLFIFKGKSIITVLDMDFFIIFAFSFTYSAFVFFGDNRGVQYLIIQTLFPATFYILGKLLITKEITNKQLIILIVISGFIYSITILLSTFNNLVVNGLNQTDRFIPSFWSNDEIKATKAASFLIYNTVIPAILVANRKRFNLIFKIVLLVMYALTLIASFRLGSRTLIVVSIFTLMVSIIYIVFNQSLLANLKLISSLTALSVITYLFIPINFDSPIFSTLGHRMKNGATESTATAGNRTQLWTDGLGNLFQNPLGWEYHMHHHNLWLDIAKEATIIPLLFFLIHNFLSLSNIKKLFRISPKDLGLNVTFFLVIFSTYLLFFTEPVIEGNFFSIVVYCLYAGLLKKFLENKKAKNI